MSLSKQKYKAPGFSLLELVVVLAITASMTVTLMPSFLEQAKYQAADKHVDTVLTMHHALRTYYDVQLNDGDPANNANLFPDGTNDCQELVSSGVLPTIPANTWGGTFSCSMQSIDSIHQMAQLTVSDVPDAMATYLQAQLPLTSCEESTPTTMDCTSTILPPNADEILVPGCMELTAANYNPLATEDDGSCICYRVIFMPCGGSSGSAMYMGSWPYSCQLIDGMPAQPSDLGKVVSTPSYGLSQVAYVAAVPFFQFYGASFPSQAGTCIAPPVPPSFITHGPP